MLNFIDHIAFKRDNAPPGMEWKKIGKLFYDDKKDRAKVLLLSFHQGLCIATPSEFRPFLQGEIMVPVMAGPSGEIEYAFVGFISSGENAKSATIYHIILESMPLVSFSQGVWCDVSRDEEDTDKTSFCPFDRATTST